jgi:hypothetical protein
MRAFEYSKIKDKLIVMEIKKFAGIKMKRKARKRKQRKRKEKKK